jgi:hypothetical protein
LEKEGKKEIAQQLRDLGIDKGPKPVAISPTERHQQERTGIDKADVAQQVLSAWQQSDDGKSFNNALQENNLTLAHGQKCDVIIDSSGNTHALSRLLNLATKENGVEKIQPAQIVERIAGTEIPTVKSFQEFRASLPVSTPENTKQDKEKTEVQKVAPNPTKAPVSGGHGGHTASQSPTQAPETSTSQEAIDGPGEAPGENATPDQIAQYRKRLYDYDQKKAQAWLAMQKSNSKKTPVISTTGGTYAGPTKEQQNAINEASQRFVENLFRKPVLKFNKPQTSGPRPSGIEPSDNGRIAEGERNESPEGKRPEGIERGSIQRNHVSSEQRESFAIADTSGTNGERVEHDPTDFRSLDGSKRNVDQLTKQIALSRIKDRQLEKALSNLVTPEKSNLIDRMIRRLKENPTIESTIGKNVEAIQSRINTTLDTKPIKDPNELDRKFQTKKICDKLYGGIAERKTEFAGLSAKVESAKSQIPRWAKFWPLQLESELKAEKLAKRLENLESNISNLNSSDYRDIANSELTGGHIAFCNTKKNQDWEKRPDVVKATETQDLLNRASDSALSGDSSMQKLLLENRIKEALELQKARDEESKKEIALKLSQETTNERTQSTAAAAPPSGPKFR